MEDMALLCLEKHKAVDMRLDSHDRQLEKQDSDISTLQKSDAKNTSQLDNLTSAIGGQTKAIWGLVSTIVFMLIGFVFWYIQTLGRV